MFPLAANRLSLALYVDKRGMAQLLKMMKAVRIHKFGGPEVLKTETIPIPSIKHNEVLIRVRAAGINPADTYIRSGGYGLLPELPAILGKDVAGEVEEVGETVKNFKKGQRVFAELQDRNGGYAEYVACPEDNVFPLAHRLTFSQGAGLYIPYVTAYRGLVTKCKAKAGQLLLVHGASGAVGVAAVQLAKSLGLTVVGTAGSSEGLELVKKVGADHVFNHRTDGYLENAVKTVGKFDIIFENLSNVNLGADLTVMNKNASIAIVGCRGTVEINPRLIMQAEATVHGVFLYNSTSEERQAAIDNLLDGIAKGWVNPAVAKEYKFEEASQAHHDIIHTKGATGRLVLTP
ncbi:quinone oxidoreductase-like isoform X1 [Schistocerca cancellata]|uniref:quinone oxidoreductase-like isoform X1 n=1 Tax=Schistocerca cancellata TaxID=274614 RepID=UPI0021199538|nr:quinone oxidoreductase-like isoform X1 [Schistocerca cancellata]